ncbi:MAG: hypothetical protein ACAI44_39270 [Candidatus Sericytochromatia bacterium]
MHKRTLIPALLLSFSALVSLAMPKSAAEPAATLPNIPGITAPDSKPNACVECHKHYPQGDFRLTSILKSWATKTDEHILAKAQSTMPAGVKLEGRHPDVSQLVKVVPTDCLMCHRGGSERVPQFRKLIHLIHLTGGKENHFLMHYGGTCTHCHKLDANTGTWSIGSGKEEP